jgi:hypothetical protein
MRSALCAYWTVLGIVFLSQSASALPVTLDFETPESAATVETKPGNLYAGLGVSFETVLLSGSVVVGGSVSLASVSTSFQMIENANAISGDQLIRADFGGPANDLLMAFAAPVSSVSLITDDFAETPDTVRLIALSDLGGGTFEVLAFDATLDDAVSGPANVLSVSLPGGFSYALFEVTTEGEGFDDLTFVPEPGSALLLATVVLGVATARRRRVH